MKVGLSNENGILAIDLQEWQQEELTKNDWSNFKLPTYNLWHLCEGQGKRVYIYNDRKSKNIDENILSLFIVNF